MSKLIANRFAVFFFFLELVIDMDTSPEQI